MDGRWHLRKDGSRFFASGVVAPVRDAAGGILGFIKVARDITDRIRYEEALRAGKEQMDLLLDSTLEGIYGVDREGGCIFANAGCLRILGLRDRSDIVGKDAHALFHHSHPEGRPYPREECPIHHACASEGRESDAAREDTFWRAGGGPLPVEYRCRAMRKEGRILGSVVTFLDISERKRMEERLKRAEEHRFEARKMEAIGRLAGGVAHEFNNSLTAINGYAELLLRTIPDDDPSRAGLEEIRKAGGKAAAVTQHLLSYGRQQMLQPRPVDLNGLIGSLAKLLAKVVGGAAELRLSLAPGLAPVFVDPGLMEQAIIGLTMNACEALDAGGSIVLETRNTDLEEEMPGVKQMIPPGRYVVLAHSDSGKGIPEEMLENVFDPFYSTKPMGSRAIGMGLSSLYGFIRQSGGYLLAESRVGKGTRFSIFLPRAEGAGEVRAGEGG
jgi:PAS domain S-box-containing protein